MVESAADRYERAIVARSLAQEDVDHEENSNPPFNQAARSVMRARAANAATELVAAEAAYIQDRAPKWSAVSPTSATRRKRHDHDRSR